MIYFILWQQNLAFKNIDAKTDKKLLDALMQQGIPRDQIVLAYDGESIPDAEKFQLDA